MPIEPLTKKELEGYFQIYRDAFPDWNVEHNVMLTRSLGPISQQIDFQGLSYGAYRPSCSIRVTGPPDYSYLLNQYLDVKHRQVERRQHPTKWPLVLKAIEEQFVPNVRKPLDIAEVFRLAEAEAKRDGIENIRYLNGLATLSVHVGQTERALHWCDRAENWLTVIGREPADWELSQAKFTRQLRHVLHSGRALEFLAETLDQSSN